ncbi:uncharacterized protein L201_003377 [Kwoniella dendrophila CBS 6074]|uniref:Smr domain-containing protein n=1 Tax=Kwoniella dendrophila CBS 6074 TaxID=1295534 RepID=A0AAX4JSR6_9TREE
MKEEQPIDPGSLAAVLSADYPLIDPPLILAILSDYPPSSLSTNIQAIKDQLGILEATLVPDPDEPEIPSEFAESWTESTSLSGIDDELSRKLDGLSTNEGDNRTSTTWTSLDDRSKQSSTTKSSRSGSDNSGKSQEINEEYLDESELLRSLFPSMPETDLTSVLHSYPAIQDAIDHLLSLELIRNVEEEGHWPEDEGVRVLSEPEVEDWESTRSRKPKSKAKSKSKTTSRASSKPPSIESSPLATASPRFDDYPLPSSTPHSRASTAGSSMSISLPSSTANKKKKKDKITFPLVDTLQRKPSPAPSRSSRSQVKSSATPDQGSRSSSPARIAVTDFGNGNNDSKSGPVNNPWHTVTSLSSYLSDILPNQPQTYFLSYLHSPDYHSAYSAILAALAKLPPSTPSTNNKNKNKNEMDFSSSREILEDIYGFSLTNGSDNDHDNSTIERDLEICVHAAGDDVATVLDLMNLLNEISEWPNDDDYPNDPFEPKHQPDYSINHTPIIKPPTISLNLPPLQAIGMERSSSAGSTISNKSVDDHLPTKLNVSTLPGKMTKPEKKSRPTKQIPEGPLLGGAIREAKIREVPGSKLSNTSLSHPTALDSFGTVSPVIPSSPNLGPRKQIHPQNWRTVQHVRPSSSTNKGGIREKKLTVEQCMANAQLERTRRETAIRAAGRSFKTNTNGIAGGGRAVKGVVAGHYAEQAQQAAARAREWELKAARIVVNSHLSGTQHNHTSSLSPYGHTNNSTPRPGRGGNGGGGGNKTIDLHNLTINEAITVVNEVLNNWWMHEKEIRLERWKKQEEGKFIIITGVGRHSVNNKGVLGPAVAGDLEKNGWKVDRGDSERGYLVVRGR